ncbi:hypothetical protein OIDMADRAFT_60777 [Oidiodendron maius Zn]|uniref:Uncharacterized protein n=1 Tax=Oidiodendron maius (strain Zn) TaxID=913774 RepID=A0A0C3GVV3_OIDMZ|nr:hypothetical protein OIDMADRAFT_60777 [Oidiodendron maius Zn]
MYISMQQTAVLALAFLSAKAFASGVKAAPIPEPKNAVAPGAGGHTTYNSPAGAGAPAGSGSYTSNNSPAGAGAPAGSGSHTPNNSPASGAPAGRPHRRDAEHHFDVGVVNKFPVMGLGLEMPYNIEGGQKNN